MEERISSPFWVNEILRVQLEACKLEEEVLNNSISGPKAFEVLKRLETTYTTEVLNEATCSFTIMTSSNVTYSCKDIYSRNTCGNIYFRDNGVNKESKDELLNEVLSTLTKCRNLIEKRFGDLVSAVECVNAELSNYGCSYILVDLQGNYLVIVKNTKTNKSIIRDIETKGITTEQLEVIIRDIILELL